MRPAARFRIGDVVVGVERRDGGLPLARPAYGPFRVEREDAPPDVAVTALPGPAPAVSGMLRFRSDETWSLWEAGDGFLFRPAGGPGTAWISETFREVRVYGLDPEAPVLDYPLDELLFVHLLPDLGGVLLHASAVVQDGRALGFTGVSGTGKSTMATLWASARGAPVLSDDRVVLRVREDAVWCHGTPWHGTAGRALGGGAPLGALHLLTQSRVAYRRPPEPDTALARLLPCVFLPHWDPGRTAWALEALHQIVTRIPPEEVGFFPHPACLDTLFPREAA